MTDSKGMSEIRKRYQALLGIKNLTKNQKLELMRLFKIILDHTKPKPMSKTVYPKK